MVDPNVKSLQRQVDRLEARCAALETVVFKSTYNDTIDGVEAVKVYLRKNDILHLAPHVINFLLDRLPVDWRLLARDHGAVQAFRLLAEDYSIVEARRRLA